MEKQDEWFDANNDGIVTKTSLIPMDIDYSLWNGLILMVTIVTKEQKILRVKCCWIKKFKSSNILITGPNGYSKMLC
jgi:hypothetical protein